VEALYKPLRFKAPVSFQDGVVIGFAPATTVTWQFPVLAKYEFALGRVRPFLEGGPSFRTVGNPSSDPSHFGVTAGVGAETGWRRLRIAPRVRYTRWAEDPWYSLPTRSDQLEFLVGVSYAATSDAHPLGRRIALGAVLACTVSADFPTATETMFDPLTGKSTTFQTSSGPRRPGVGPLVELGLSARFSIEGNAASRSIRGATRIVKADRLPPSLGVSSWPFTSGAFWEFPVLTKYRLTTSSARPFLALGPSFRLPKEIGGAWLSNYGATAGAGVEIPLKRIKIAPAVRYTHWGPDRPRVAGTEANSGVSRNQMQVLVGVSF
jgi:hypothetical protein